MNAQIKPHNHIDYPSVAWDRCSDVLKKRLSSLQRRAVNLIIPDTTLTTDQKLKEMRIMSLPHNLNITKVYSCTGSLTMRPQSIYLTCTHTHLPSRYSNFRNYQLSLPKPRIDKLKTSLSFAGDFFGTTPL